MEDKYAILNRTIEDLRLQNKEDNQFMVITISDCSLQVRELQAEMRILEANLVAALKKMSTSFEIVNERFAGLEGRLRLQGGRFDLMMQAYSNYLEELGKDRQQGDRGLQDQVDDLQRKYREIRDELDRRLPPAA